MMDDSGSVGQSRMSEVKDKSQLTLEEMELKYDEGTVEKVRRAKRLRAARLDASLGEIEDETENAVPEADEWGLDGKGEAEVKSYNKRKRALHNARLLHKHEEEDPETDEEDGTVLEPFNMRKEMKEGTIDSDGHFLYKKQTGKEPDRWVESLHSSDVKISADSRRQVEENAGKFAGPFERVDVKAALRAIHDFLKRGESPNAALRRMSKDFAPAKRNRNKITLCHSDREAFDRLTELCHKLMCSGQNIYQEAREDIFDLWEAATSRQDASPSEGTHWMMRIKTDRKLEGPFPGSTILSWINHKLLSNEIEITQCNESGETFDNVWHEPRVSLFGEGMPEQLNSREAAKSDEVSGDLENHQGAPHGTKADGLDN